MDPYYVLDLSPKSSTAEIKARFRCLALMYHPDKCNLTFVGPDYWKEIQSAYGDLMRMRRDSRMPDYDIKYTNVEQEIDAELKDILSMNDNNPEVGSEFSDAFNKRFMEVNKAFEDLRPWNRGYNSFGSRLPTKDTIVKNFEYNNPLSVEWKKPVFNIKGTLDISNYTGKLKNDYGLPQANYGISPIKTFSTETAGKTSLFGSDIGDSWPDQVVFTKFSPDEQTGKTLKEKLEKKINEREDYVIPPPEEVPDQKAINEENAVRIQNEQQKADEEYKGIFHEIKKAIGWM